MIVFKQIFPVITILAVICSSFLLIGCEDDPILTPENGNGGNGGSYGRIDQIGTEPDAAGKLVHSKRRADATKNPVLF